MGSDVNRKITEKIDGGPFDDSVKTFLKLMLGHELEHFSEATWRFRGDYEREILKAVREKR